MSEDGLEDWTPERERESGFGRAYRPTDTPRATAPGETARRYLTMRPKYDHYKGEIVGPYCRIDMAWLKGVHKPSERDQPPGIVPESSAIGGQQ